LLISTKPLYAEARLNFDGEKFNILNQVWYIPSVLLKGEWF
jgi:hypothetical protein